MQEQSPAQTGHPKNRNPRAILVGIVVVFGLVILGTLLNELWITNDEMAAAGYALDAIDRMEAEDLPTLKDCEQSDVAGFLSEGEATARSWVRATRNHALTSRDRRMSWLVQTYFLAAEQDRLDALFGKQLSLTQSKGVSIETFGKCRASKSDATLDACFAAHKALHY